MRRLVLAALLSGTAMLGLSLSAVPARALAVADAPAVTLTQKIIRSDTIVVGQVQAVAEKTEKVKINGVESDFTIATIKIDKVLRGSEGDTHIRVGLLTAAAPVGRSIRAVTLTKDQRGIFFLTRSKDVNFARIPPMGYPINDQAENYKAELEKVERLTTILKDPKKALKTSDAKERLSAVHLVLLQLGTASNPDGKPMKQVPIEDKELSKLVLTALAEAEWPTGPQLSRPDELDPRILFWQLSVTPQDGWTPPRVVRQPGEKFNAEKYQEQMIESQKAWLKKHAGTFQLKTWIVDKNAPAVAPPPIVPEPGIAPPPANAVPGRGLPIRGQAVPLPAKDVAVPPRK